MNDPIQVALENRTISWGEFAIEEALPAGWTAYPDIIQEKEEDVMENFLEPQRCVRFAEEPQPQKVCIVEEDDSFTVVKSTKTVKPVANPAKIKTVVVRNLPRNTTPEQLGKRFTQYGEVADVYLPKNMDASKGPVGSIKGFAMIRFTNPLASAMAIATEKSRGEQIEFAKADRV